MRIKITENTYLGNTDGVEVDAIVAYGISNDILGYDVLGEELINEGVDVAIDPAFGYFLKSHQVKVIKD